MSRAITSAAGAHRSTSADDSPANNAIFFISPTVSRSGEIVLKLDHFRCFSDHAEPAEAAGFRNGDRQFGAHRAAHTLR